MSESSEARVQRESVTQLFDEFLLKSDAGEQVDLEALLRRAGDRRDDLARRVGAWRELTSLGASLRSEPALPDLEAQQRIGRYELVESLGRGGFSEVFRARDSHLGRELALKVFTARGAWRADQQAWLLNEGRSLAKLEHPNIVRVFDVDRADEHAYIAMELVRGVGLDLVLARLRDPDWTGAQQPLVERIAARLAPLAARCRLIADVADALAACHRAGVVHRDVKPANVLIDENGTPKLIDFGIAHLDADEPSSTDITTQLVGTANYIAPEQVDRHQTGSEPASDQFVLGVLLYELVTLRHPFAGATRATTMDAISRCEPAPPRRVVPTIADDLERIILHCLERDPRDRYATVADLAADLRAFFEFRAISLPAPTLTVLARRYVRTHRRRLRIVVAVAFLMAFAVATSLGSVEWRARHAFERDLASLPAAHAKVVGTFTDRFERLSKLRDDAHRLDARLASHLFQGSLANRVADAIVQTSDMLAASIEDAAADSARLGVEFDASAWYPALDREKLLCADCTANLEWREHGVFELAPSVLEAYEVTTYARQRSHELRVHLLFDAILPIRPPPGRYRVSARHRTAEAEGFDVDVVLAGGPQFTLDVPSRMHPAAGELRDVEIDPASLDELTRPAFPPGAASSIEPEYVTPGGGFRIRATPVTWAELEAFATDAPAWRAALDGDLDAAAGCGAGTQARDPACVRPVLAHAYATACGMRLPSLLELALAFRRGVIAPVERPGVAGELTGCPDFSNDNDWRVLPYAMPDLVKLGGLDVPAAAHDRLARIAPARSSPQATSGGDPPPRSATFRLAISRSIAR